MGQESSTPIDPSIPPQHLSSRTLPAIASYISTAACSRIVFMVGAGISTSSGIPDFRSPDTGLYSQLSSLNLPRPEAVFDISYFRENPYPFYTLARELWPGFRYKPSKTHCFMKLVENKGKLGRVYTQNIDTLELAAGVSREKIIFAHGSFDGQRCIECKAEADREELEEHVRKALPMRCRECGGLVKPDITFFGEALDSAFHDSLDELRVPMKEGGPTLVIVMGSSLSVYPFAALPQMVDEETPRMLVNKEEVGEVGGRRDDVVWLGDCDDGVEKLAAHLGWSEELEKLWKETRGEEAEKGEEAGTEDERVEREVGKLVEEVERGLKMAEEHKERTEKVLGLENAQEKPEEKKEEAQKEETAKSEL